MDNHLPQLLTTSEVAELLRITEARLRVLRHKGEGPKAIKLPSGSVRYSVESVRAWIEGDR